MHKLERWGLALGVVALVGACNQQRQSGEYVEEASVVEEIPVTTDSDAARTHYEQGQALFDVGRGVAALDHFRLAVEQDPTFVRAHVGIANTVFSPEDARAAVAAASEHLSDASEGERLMVEIVRAGQNNNTDRQLELARELVAAYPNSPRAYLVLAGVQGARQEVLDARASLDRAVELDPEMVGAHAGVFFSTMFQEPYDYTTADRHAARVIEVDPENPMGYSFRGDVQRAREDYEGARAHYTTALDKDPALGLAALKRGIVNTFLGNYDEARADYELASEVDRGTNRIVNANFGAFVHVYEGDPRAAIEQLRSIDAASESADLAADELRSVRQFTLANAATIALFNEMIPQARSAIDEMTVLIRANAEATGDEDFTRQQEAAIKIWEGRIAARSGDYRTALARAEENRALLEPDANPRKLEPYHDLLGLIALRRGNAAEAVTHYEQGNIQNPFIKYHLALAHEAAGNVERAQALFEEVADYQFVSAGTALVRPAAIEKLARSTA